MTDAITISARVLSRNVINRQHWSQTRRQMQEYCLLIRNQMRLNKIRKLDLTAKTNLHIECTTKRVMDYDNLVGGCKGLIDALWREGFIGDDSPKFTTMQITQTTGKQYSVTITREHHENRINKSK